MMVIELPAHSSKWYAIASLAGAGWAKVVTLLVRGAASVPPSLSKESNTMHTSDAGKDSV
jgi:hypothetical protein